MEKIRLFSKWCSGGVLSLYAVIVALSFCAIAADAQQPNAVVHFELRGLTQYDQLLSAIATPEKTGLGKPPIVVKVTGGTPPYVVTCSNPQGYDIRPTGDGIFTATRVMNGIGTSYLTITDSLGKSVQVALQTVLTGLATSHSAVAQPPQQGAASPGNSSGVAHVRFVLNGLNVPTQPLAATANPQMTGLGKPPAIVTITGGHPPYTVSSSNPNGYNVQATGINTFTVTRILNGIGTTHFTVTDSSRAQVQVGIQSILTGLNIR